MSKLAPTVVSTGATATEVVPKKSLFNTKKKPKNVNTNKAILPPPPPPPPQAVAPPPQEEIIGWERELEALQEYLNEQYNNDEHEDHHTHSFEIVQIAADGSCLFNAFKEQLAVTGSLGKEGRKDLRKQCLDYMVDNSNDFKPYIDDTEDNDATSFETYVKKMRRHDAWGGHLEIQALSKLLEVNVLIFQQQASVNKIEIANFPRDIAPTILLSYHMAGDQHYNAIIDRATRKPKLYTIEELEHIAKNKNEQMAKKTETEANSARNASNSNNILS